MTSSAQEYATAAVEVPFGTPMSNTAVGVCELRQTNPFEIVFLQGYPLPRWQAVIAEGMMLHSIAKETAHGLP